MTDMTSQTVSDNFQKAIDRRELKRKPTLQTDNGSCFIGKDFKQLILNLDINHNRISPHCPNQNAEIERCNRTIKECLLEYPVPKTFQELENIINNVITYYNDERYHSSLNFLPPKIYYRGNPGVILEERKKRLKLAKKRRIIESLTDYNSAKVSSLKIAICPTSS